ncbi:uncharacterized protein JCM15063_003627 [Sporobolomyces koalae]|uniref:uncharacterized protein n=1 Tax=Sporobolomyces koalae TaxID=500713 RepID=UPI00316E296F
MDPFEVRMQFLTLISRVNSSLQSLSKVSHFALRHADKCSDDIWDCYLDELTHSPNLNHRINLLYWLDLVLDKEGPKVVDKTSVGGLVGQGSYRALIERDLDKVLNQVVPPDSKQAVLNHMSAMQVLKSWKTRRLLDNVTLDAVIDSLQDRKATLHAKALEDPESGSTDANDSSTFTSFSRNDIMRRIEDDRERHKRLRERIWVLPIPTTIYQAPLLVNSSPINMQHDPTKPSPISPASPFEPPNQTGTPVARNSLTASLQDKDKNGAAITTASSGRGPELALQIEFDQLWEQTLEERRLVLGPDDPVDDNEDHGRKRRRIWDLGEEEKREIKSESDRCFVAM